MDAVAGELGGLRGCALQTNPALADWILRIVGLELLTSARVGPLWINELGASAHFECSHGSGVIGANAAGEASNHHALRAGAGIDIETVISLDHFAIKWSVGKFQAHVGAQGLFTGNLIDALNESPIDGKLFTVGDPRKAVALLDYVALASNVARNDVG